MAQSQWLRRFQSKLQLALKAKPAARRSRSGGQSSTNRPTPQPVEILEDRSLMSVSALVVNGGELTIVADGDEDIAVQATTTGQLQVLVGSTERGVPLTALNNLPVMQASTLTSINIEGGSDGNQIDLSGVSVANSFSATLSILVNGENGNDVLIGSPDHANELHGGDGTDEIRGGDIGDTLNGGDGADTIFGDIVPAGTLDPSVLTNGGNDTITAGDGSDTVQGVGGNDSIVSGDGNDLINGGVGDDSVDGNNGTDTLLGNGGNDTLTGDGGVDSVSGGDGNDVIFGGEFNDTLQGDAGNDSIEGQSGIDSIDGGVGDDIVRGGSGNDSLVGNDGNDTISGDMGNDTVDGGFADDVIFGGGGNDSLLGNIGDDTIQGQAGNDSLDGGGGEDILNGGAGADLVRSGVEDPLALTPNNPVIISAADAVVAEGNVGTTNLMFNLTLSRAVNFPVTVVVSTLDGTATAADYQRVPNQVVTFPANTTTQTVTVLINGDGIVELNETVRLVLSSPSPGARLQNQEAIGTITDDDSATVGLAALSRNGGTLFSVNANTATPTQIGATTPPLTGAVDISASGNGTTAIGLEFLSNGQNIFTINTSNGVITNPNPVGGAIAGFNLLGDVAYDRNSNILYAVFSTAFQSGGGQGPAAAAARATPNLFSIDVTTGQSTDLGRLTNGGTNLQSPDSSGNAPAVDFDYLAFGNGILYGVISGGLTGAHANFNDSLFTINPTTLDCTRIGPLNLPLGASLGGMEFDTTSNQLYLLDGPTGNLYTIDQNPNTPTSGNATFIGNSTLANSSGLATGALPPPPPAPLSVSVSNPTVIVEGDLGPQMVTFDVTVGASAGGVTVNYQTVDGTATAGIDYLATSGTLTFSAAGGTQTVMVTVNGDTQVEADETFFLQLVTATGGAVIADGSGVATIGNNDLSTGPVSFAVGDTLSGDTGNDTLIGDAGNDVINGGADNDSVLAGEGNDSVTGGAGSDTLDGQGGNDTLAGQGGADLLIGGDGEDVFQWNAARDGKDTMVGTSGADVLQVLATGMGDTINVGALGEELLFTSGGNSALTAPTINRVDIFAGLGNDVINVGDLSGTRLFLLQINGEAGNDVINAINSGSGRVRILMDGNEGNDTLIGGNGTDTLRGGAGDDNLRGGDNNDMLIGGAGIDVLNGQAGDDTLTGDETADTISGAGTGSADSLLGGDGNDSMSGGGGADTLDGENGNDTIRGNDGADTITGSAGNDSLFGEIGTDALSGGAGNDTLDGGRNDDTLSGNSGDDRILGDHGHDNINGGDGNNTILGGDGNDTIRTGSGNDAVFGGDGDDLINTDGGNDLLIGGDGNDTLLGGGGNDTLLGRDGADSLNGQGGADTVAGNEGVDVIVAEPSEIDELFALGSLDRLLLASLGITA